MKKALLMIFALTAFCFTIACDKSESLTTYPAVKAWHEAIRKKDSAAYRKATFGYLFMNGQKISVGGDFSEKLEQDVFKDEQQIHTQEEVKLRNEQISHNDKLKADFAMVEWQDGKGNWRLMNLIKEENSDWKMVGFAH